MKRHTLPGIKQDLRGERMKRYPLFFAVLIAALLVGCVSGQIMDGPGMVNSYRQIDQITAEQMMERDDGHVIVDVRRKDEYDAGHIPGAILIPNEDIGTEQPALLPDLDQIILIYCRSGNRSKEAAQKLFDMGYTHVYEFGGINTWTGEIVTEEGPAVKGVPAELAFESFDGGGPEYSVEISDPTVVSYTRRKAYASPEHEEMDGAGYSVIFTFTGLRPGETQAEITSRSPITEGEIYVYALTVDEQRNVTATLLTVEDMAAFVKSTPTLVIEAKGKQFYATLEDNASAEAFIELLSSGGIEVEMQDYGGFEKAGALPWQLPGNDEEITAKPGDLILCQGDRITICYDQNTWSFTRLARIGSVTKQQLLEAFGEGDVTVSFWLEWSE